MVPQRSAGGPTEGLTAVSWSYSCSGTVHLVDGVRRRSSDSTVVFDSVGLSGATFGDDTMNLSVPLLNGQYQGGTKTSNSQFDIESDGTNFSETVKIFLGSTKGDITLPQSATALSSCVTTPPTFGRTFASQCQNF